MSQAFSLLGRLVRHSAYSVLADRLMPNLRFLEAPRASLARVLLQAKIGPGVTLNPHIDFGQEARFISVGDGSHLQRRCTLYAIWGEPIEIGRDVFIGAETMLWTGTHEIGPHAQRCGAGLTRPIRIGDGCWLGARVTVLGGVEIGAGSVIAAGALVSKSVPPDELWGGVPARCIRRLDTLPEGQN